MAVIGTVVLLAAVLGLPGGAVAGPSGLAEPAPDIEVFVREGCPHCAAAEIYLTELQHRRPGLRVAVRDVARDPAALVRLRELAEAHGARTLGVPAFHLRDQLILGFGGRETTGATLEALLDRPALETPNGVRTRWFGFLSVRELGLPAFTLAVGLLDGFNPCAMWVLLFLLSLLASLQNRLRMAVVAGTFVIVSGLVYFAFMAAWLNVFLLIGLSRATQVVLGAIALGVGGINVKDFVAFRRGVSLTIPETAKPTLYERVRRVVQAENLTGALVGVVVLAVLVNLLELLCTAGFPAVYTEVLSLRHLPGWQYYAYLGLYNVAYMLDDTVMVIIAVVTLGHRKLQEKEGRWLKLVSGIVMVSLGAVLLFAPGWLMW